MPSNGTFADHASKPAEFGGQYIQLRHAAVVFLFLLYIQQHETAYQEDRVVY